jgi:hypothetical protein
LLAFLLKGGFMSTRNKQNTSTTSRKLLAQLQGQRVGLEATVTDFRTVEDYKGPVHAVLLTQITLTDGTPVLKACWCALTRGHRMLRLEVNDRIAFVARIKRVSARARRSLRARNLLQRQPLRLSRPTHLHLILPCEAEAELRRGLERASQACQTIANQLARELFLCVAWSDDLRFPVCAKSLPAFSRYAITVDQITATPGCHALRAYCQGWGMQLDVVEGYPCAACLEGEEDFDSHGEHREAEKEFHVRIRWGPHFPGAFYVACDSQEPGFCLVPEDEAILNIARQALTLVLAQPTLTPDQHLSLQAMQQCLACLAQRRPPLATNVEIVQRIPGTESMRYWGMWLTTDNLEIFSGGSVAGDTFHTPELLLQADGYRELSGNLQVWVARLEQALAWQSKITVDVYPEPEGT